MKHSILRRLAKPGRSIVARHKRVGALADALVNRFPRVQDLVVALAESDPTKSYAAWVAEYDTLDESDLVAIAQRQSELGETPLLSLVVPLAGATAGTLDAVEKSILAQVYELWELWFVGEVPDDPNVRAFLANAPTRDGRITPFRSSPSAPEAWSDVLGSVRGEIAVLLDGGVLLRPHALSLFASTIVNHPDALLIYADEDVIDEQGARADHHFKPDWNEALLRSQNYFGDLVGFRRDRAIAVGGCRDEPDGELLWSLFLRMTAGARSDTVHHLPFVLSHRLAASIPERRRADTAAHEERLARLGNPANVEPVGEKSFRTRYVLPEEPPAVSIVIPTTGDPRLLGPCLEGLLRHTAYAAFEVVLLVGDLEKKRPEERALIESNAAAPPVRVLDYGDRPFNFSSVNNWAVEQLNNDLVCFLNDDTNVVGRDWLATMASHVLQDRVAAVGAKLYFRTDRIQHAGVVLGVGGLAAHAHRGRPNHWRGYHDRALIDQDVSCVTAACMLVRRDVFLEVGGFDEAFSTAFNDVDLCLRLREDGWRIVWTPSAELYHYESTSIGPHDAGPRERQWTSDWRLMHRRWSSDLMADPHYNANLSLDALRTWTPAFPPRVTYPWRSVTHRDAPPLTSVGDEI